jgi:hypothetical protein
VKRRCHWPSVCNSFLRREPGFSGTAASSYAALHPNPSLGVRVVQPPWRWRRRWRRRHTQTCVHAMLGVGTAQHRQKVRDGHRLVVAHQVGQVCERLAFGGAPQSILAARRRNHLWNSRGGNAKGGDVTKWTWRRWELEPHLRRIPLFRPSRSRRSRTQPCILQCAQIITNKKETPRGQA